MQVEWVSVVGGQYAALKAVMPVEGGDTCSINSVPCEAARPQGCNYTVGLRSLLRTVYLPRQQLFVMEKRQNLVHLVMLTAL